MTLSEAQENLERDILAAYTALARQPHRVRGLLTEACLSAEEFVALLGPRPVPKVKQTG